MSLKKKKPTSPTESASTPENSSPEPKKKTAPKKSAAKTPSKPAAEKPTREPAVTATKPAAETKPAAAKKPAAARAAAPRAARPPASPRPARGSKASAPEASQATPPPAAALPAAPRDDREPRLRILMVTPEVHPFAKTGGLAEVTAALPSALARQGHNVTVVVPRYQKSAIGSAASRTTELAMGPRTFAVGFIEQRMPDGVRVVLVDVPELFDRPGLYGEDGKDYPDNALRFALLSRAALEFARLEGHPLDIIHAHDWQAGLVPVYQKMLFSDDPVIGGVPVVFTIHNLAFQGVFGRDALPMLGLGWEVFNPDALEYWGNISLLKGGVNFSEAITTVSPTYAREILTPELGFGFDGTLRRRAASLRGILNGIDTDRWDPAGDAYAPHFSAENLEGKREAKRVLLEAVGLEADAAALDRPLIGLISRLTDQKGFDLIGAASDALMALDASWVMLGSGERHYEDQWRALAASRPDRVSTTIGFDERLAHLIEAGADMFLMPSRFEPCGLNQLYSLRYGTIPIVRSTGGLRDTVTDANQPGGNGIVFEGFAPAELLNAVRRAVTLFADKPKWQALQRAGMAFDPSWDVSGREYVKVYGQLERRKAALERA